MLPNANSVRTTLIDPPWPERGSGKVKRGADRHYKTLKPHEILSTILRSGHFEPAANAHLYLWVTNTFLESGLWLMRALGFRYVTNIAWVKPNAGLGQYFRGQHELLLYGVRGAGRAVCTQRRDLPGVLHEPRVGAGRGIHSAKPASVYELIEARSVGPYVELFARTWRHGWVSWGDQLEAEPPMAAELSMHINKIKRDIANARGKL